LRSDFGGSSSVNTSIKSVAAEDGEEGVLTINLTR
jgi:hypothetical protein